VTQQSKNKIGRKTQLAVNAVTR